MSNVDTSPLGSERAERIAGDEALNSRLDNVTAELQGTQESVSTEVLHRSEGDLVIQRILEGYIQDLLDGKSEEFERYLEFQNSQNLNYADVRNFISSIRASLAEEIRNLTDTLMTNLQVNDERYNKLVSDVGRYLDILSDITLDSNQITLDDGELRAGAWTILSQARQWDLDIISRLNGLSASVGDSLKDAVEEIQNQLPSTEETISKAIEELSKSPFIKELSDLLSQSIENDSAHQLALVDQARQHAAAMSQLAEELRAEAAARAQDMEEYMAGEVATRITEVNKEVSARKEAIDLLAEEMLTRADLDKAEFLSDMSAVTDRIKSAEDGLTSEIQHRKDGDASTLNALNIYKVSNDSAITGLSTSLSNNVTKTNANTTLINGLTARMTTAESGIENATTAAADAMTKATTAVTANTALATRVDALAASITESEGTTVDVNAFNALKAEVTSVQGVVTGLTEDVTTLESNYTSVNNKVSTHGTSISTLNNKMTAAENSISQSANDITLLKTDITDINSNLLTKVDSQAFSQLSSDVSELEGNYTTQAGLVTDLRGSLDTTIINVSNAATAAQNAMNAAGSKGKVIFGTSAPAAADRLSQNLWIDTTGGANTPKRWNGSAWVVVTDKVATDALEAANAATTLAHTKADTSAFNSLDQKVNVMDGVVSANTNSITSLSGKIEIVEGGLATKLDSASMVNYYTKQQADDKALSTAAGEISKFSASLRIGGDNLLKNSNVPIHKPLGTQAYFIGYYEAGESLVGKDVTLTACISVSGGIEGTYRLVGYQGSGISIVFTEFEVETANSQFAIVHTKFKWTSSGGYNATRLHFYAYPNSAYSQNMEITVHWATLVEGYVVPSGSWIESKYDLKTLIDVNSTAIQNTNTEVERVDGKTLVNSNAITGLTSRMDTAENQISLKANSSALQNYYTKTEADDEALLIAAGEISKYDASLVIGGSNLIPDSYMSFRVGSVSQTQLVRNILGDGSLKITNAGSLTTSYLANFQSANTTFTELIGALQDKEDFTVTLWFKAVDTTNLPTITPPLYLATGMSYLKLNGDPTALASGKEVPYSHTRKWVGSTSSITPHLSFTPASLGGGLILTKWKIEKGSKSTDWSESSQDIQGALDANATAIENTNAEVIRVDDRVTTEANRITTLSGRVDTVEGGLSTKATVDGLNALTTRVAEVEGGISTQATETTNLKSSLATTDKIAKDALPKIGGSGSFKTFKEVLNYYHASSSIPSNIVIQTPITYSANMFRISGKGYNYSSTKTVIDFDVSGYAYQSTGSILQHGAKNNGTFPMRIRLGMKDGKLCVILSPNGTNFAYPAFTVDATVSYGSVSDAYQTGWSGTLITEANLASSGITNIIEPSLLDLGLEITSYANAIETLTTDVSQIDETVTSNANKLIQLTSDITTINGTLATKANASALNDIYTKSQTVDKATEIAAGKVEEFKANLSIGGHNLIKGSNHFRTGSGATTVTRTILEDGSLQFVPNGLTSTAYISQWASLEAFESFKDVVSMFKTGDDYTVTFWMKAVNPSNIPTEPFRALIGSGMGYYTVDMDLERLASGSEVRCVISQKWALSSTATSIGIYLGFKPTTIGGGLILTKFQLERGSVGTDWTEASQDIQDKIIANATAIYSLDTKVGDIDGEVTSQASQITTLTSDNADNKNALQVQGRVLNGVKANYMVKMETNGVIGGFGMIQEATGALGSVFTTFGVNADNFFIGAPSGGKKPFVVTTTNQVINGVTYPAGTYIDVAMIANATIGSAKISSIDAGKITTGTLDAARIRVGSTSKFDAGFSPADVLNDARTYVDSNTGNLVNNPSVSGDKSRWTNGTVTNQNFLGTTIPVLTLTTSGDLQVTSDAIDVDPAKAYEVSVWVKKSAAVGSTYLGLNIRNAAGTNIGINSVNQAGGTSLNTNFYHWNVSGGANPLEWRKLVAYVMPAGTDPLDMKGLGNVTSNAFMLPNTSKLQMRVLNYYNSGTTTTAWFANPKIVEVDPNAVIAAAKAQILADSKTKTFTAQPAPPYTAGDLWKSGSTIRVCTVSRASGSYVAADWTLVGDVTSANTAANSNQLGGKASSVVLNDITAAKNAADTAAANANNANNQLALWKYPNTTEIDGGKIYTNSITANKLNVTDLSAISANLGTIKVKTANIDELAVTEFKLAYGSVTNGMLLKSGWLNTPIFWVNNASTKKILSWVQMKGVASVTSSISYCELWLRRDAEDLVYKKFTASGGKITVNDFFMHLDNPTPTGTVQYRIHMAIATNNDTDYNNIKNSIKCDWMLLEAKR